MTRKGLHRVLYGAVDKKIKTSPKDRRGGGLGRGNSGRVTNYGLERRSQSANCPSTLTGNSLWRVGTKID